MDFAGAARKGFFWSLWNEYKHLMVMTLFFNAIGFHLTIACFRYFFSLKMIWGATVKEKIEVTNVWAYLYKYIIKR